MTDKDDLLRGVTIEPNGCFANCQAIVHQQLDSPEQYDRLEYVEGRIDGVPHAWLTLDGELWDPTSDANAMKHGARPNQPTYSDVVVFKGDDLRARLPPATATSGTFQAFRDHQVADDGTVSDFVDGRATSR